MLTKSIQNIFAAIALAVLSLLAACTPVPADVSPAAEPLAIYPDYTDITLPCNIAPLNFLLRDARTDALEVAVRDAQGHEALTLRARGQKAVWTESEWRQLLSDHVGQQLEVTVTARVAGAWLRYPSFAWQISPDSLDSYLTYRLIEPGYEVWDKVRIEERCTETFQTRLLADGAELGNRCMNCHTHGGNRGQYSFFHLRGKDGGTILCRDGNLRKLTLRNAQMQSGAVYGDFHPSGRYAVFSTNTIIPSFHSQQGRRFEVYDTMGDLCVADFDSNRMITLDAQAATLTSFPCFSADGSRVYYCMAPNPCGDTIPTAADLLPYVEQLHYSLYSMPFDAEAGRLDAERVEVVYDADVQGGSANLPKCSPDGSYLCFTRSAYGTFPIWHREAELCLLHDGQLVATGQHGTYHSWSHNSRWLAFASKRSDWQYGRVYFMHIDDTSSDGTVVSKPFCLPQADPENDDLNLQSYNVPDLSTIAMPFGQRDVKLLLNEVKAETFE